MRTDAATGTIALETRDPEKLLVSFWVLGVENGQILLENYQSAELWWTGLEAIAPDTLYFHGYGAESFGKHQGITAFNYKTRQTLWAHREISFYRVLGSHILAQEIHRPLAFLRLDGATGETLQTDLSLTDVQNLLNRQEQTEQYSWRTPVQYTAGGPYFDDLCRFVQSKTGKQAQLAIDYLEQESYFVLGFYTLTTVGIYQYQVVIFSKSGELSWQDILAEDLSGIGAGAFFILQETLILIKNKKTIVGLRPVF